MKSDIHQAMLKIGLNLRSNRRRKETCLLKKIYQSFLRGLNVRIGICSLDRIFRRLEQPAVSKSVLRARKRVNAEIKRWLKNQPNVDTIRDRSDFDGDIRKMPNPLQHSDRFIDLRIREWLPNSLRHYLVELVDVEIWSAGENERCHALAFVRYHRLLRLRRCGLRRRIPAETQDKQNDGEE